jgi:hypothetical protein
MEGRHQHFEDPITQTQDMRKTKFDQGGFFWSPFGGEGAVVFRNVRKC